MPGYQDPDLGYGEGLELAGAYLAAKPDAANLKAMSWYAAGPFSYYFPGTTYNLLISETVDESYVAAHEAIRLPGDLFHPAEGGEHARQAARQRYRRTRPRR